MNVDPEKVAAFVDSLDEYQPTVPDELTQYLLRTSGHDCPDVRLVRLVSLAAQNFVADAMTDTLEIHRRRKAAAPAKKKKTVVRDEDGAKPAGGGAGGAGAGAGAGGGAAGGAAPHMVLNSEDLAEGLAQYGVSLRRPLYYANAADARKPPGAAAGMALGGGQRT